MLKKLKNNNKYGYVILILLCLGLAMPNFCQYQVTSLAARLIGELELSQSAYSSIATAPLLMGIFLGFVSGMLADRFGVKMIIISVGLTALGACIRVVADSYGLMYISMMLMGFSASFVNSTTPKMMGSWFSPKKVTVLMGVVLGAANVGMALGSGTAPMFGSMRGAFAFAAVVAIVVFALWCLLGYDRKSDEKDDEGKASFKESFTVIIKNRGIWLCGLCGFSIIVGATGCSIFIPQALMSRGMTEKTAGLMSMVLTFGNVVSGIVTPLIINKFAVNKLRMRILMLIYAVCMGVLIAFSWRAPMGLPLALCLFACGFSVMSFEALVLSFPMYIKGIGRKYSATGTGLVLTMQLMGGVIVPSYIATPIAGDNYTLLYVIFSMAAVLFAVVSQLLPLDDYFDRTA